MKFIAKRMFTSKRIICRQSNKRSKSSEVSFKIIAGFFGHKTVIKNGGQDTIVGFLRHVT